jgi:hypothetical protein
MMETRDRIYENTATLAMITSCPQNILKFDLIIIHWRKILSKFSGNYFIIFIHFQLSLSFIPLINFSISAFSIKTLN